MGDIRAAEDKIGFQYSAGTKSKDLLPSHWLYHQGALKFYVEKSLGIFEPSFLVDSLFTEPYLLV